MPALSKIYEEYRDLRDRFEVLAFHDNSVKDFDELDENLKPAMKAYWGGKPLPFPVLLDTTGETVMAYGINSWPTSFLIDPEGKIVAAEAEELERILKKERLRKGK